MEFTESPHLVLLLQRRLGCLLQSCSESSTYVLQGVYSALKLSVLRLSIERLQQLRRALKTLRYVLFVVNFPVQLVAESE